MKLYRIVDENDLFPSTTTSILMLSETILHFIIVNSFYQ